MPLGLAVLLSAVLRVARIHLCALDKGRGER